MARENSRDRLWHRIAAISTAITVAAGAFAFAAPALALEAEPICNLTPHTHTETCFEERLICTLEEGAVMTTEDGLEAVHEHNNGCYETVLVCSTPEHEHSDDCYSVQPVADEADPAADAVAEGVDEGATEQGEGAAAEQAEDTANAEQIATPETAQAEPAPETEGTVTIEEDAAPMDIRTVQLYEDEVDNVRIYAVYDDEALPADAVLVASPITAESDPEKYAQLLEQTGAALDADASTLPMVLYSIRFEVNGEEVKPSSPVEIKVEFNKDAYEVSEEMTVVHFTEDGAETLENETAVEDNSVTFQTAEAVNAQ